MFFNVDKTVFMHFCLQSISRVGVVPRVVFEGHVLEVCFEHKHLGVTFTPDLKWTAHIRAACSKANRSLGMLKHQDLI